MGKFKNGVNGPFSGKIGTVIGSSWNGIPYMKALYSKRKGEPTEGESANRNKFKMAQLYLQPLVPFVREGFKNYSPTVKGFLAAKSLLMRNSFEGTPPNISINPALVKLSHGTLPLPENIQMELKNDCELHFSWNKTNALDGNAKDQVMMVAYDLTMLYSFTILTGQFRENGAEIYELPPDKGKTYYVWFAFVAHDRSRQSDSIYLGEVNV